MQTGCTRHAGYAYEVMYAILVLTRNFFTFFTRKPEISGELPFNIKGLRLHMQILTFLNSKRNILTCAPLSHICQSRQPSPKCCQLLLFGDTFSPETPPKSLILTPHNLVYSILLRRTRIMDSNFKDYLKDVLGLNDTHINAIGNQGITSFGDLKDIDEDDVKSIFRVCQRPGGTLPSKKDAQGNEIGGGTDPGIAIPLMAKQRYMEGKSLTRRRRL